MAAARRGVRERGTRGHIAIGEFGRTDANGKKIPRTSATPVPHCVPFATTFHDPETCSFEEVLAVLPVGGIAGRKGVTY